MQGVLPQQLGVLEGLTQGSILTLCGAWGCCVESTGQEQEWKQGTAFPPQHTQIKVLTVTGPVDQASLQQGS